MLRHVMKTTSKPATKKPAKSGPRPAFESADFRCSAETLEMVSGEKWWVSSCYELVDGRWEGFVSMRPAT